MTVHGMEDSFTAGMPTGLLNAPECNAELYSIGASQNALSAMLMLGLL
jgi:hypothetical protein